MKIDKRRAFLINFAYFGVMAAGAMLGVKYVLPIIMPFVIAFVIAYFLQRPVDFLEKKFGLPHKPMAMISVLMFYGIVGSVITLVGVRIVSAVIDLVGELPNFYITQVYPFFVDILHEVERVLIKWGLGELSAASGSTGQVIQSFSKMISELPGKVIDVATGFVVSVPGMFVNVVVMIICNKAIQALLRRVGT